MCGLRVSIASAAFEASLAAVAFGSDSATLAFVAEAKRREDVRSKWYRSRLAPAPKRAGRGPLESRD